MASYLRINPLNNTAFGCIILVFDCTITLGIVLRLVPHINSKESGKSVLGIRTFVQTVMKLI